jgi:hypothetical protein
VDLIQTTRNVKHERPIRPTLDSLGETLRQAERQQIGWSGVQPVLAQAECASDVPSGLGKCLRQWLCGRIAAILDEGDHV